MEQELEKALEHFEKREYSEAIEFFEKILKTNPNNARVYNNLGVAYYNNENHLLPGYTSNQKVFFLQKTGALPEKTLRKTPKSTS